MSAGRPSETEENVILSPETLDMTDWLQACFEKLEAGREHEILSDPFYTPKGGPLTEARVDAVIAALDAKYDHEIDNYPTYHERRSGANAKPEWFRLGPTARRAVVEGLERIIEDHESFAAKNVAAVLSTPAAEPTTQYDC